MRLSFCFLADAATVAPDGKAYVLGGGFSAMTLVQIPGPAGFTVVSGYRFSAADLTRTHVVEVRLVDHLGKLVMPPAQLRFESRGQPPTGVAEVSASAVSPLHATIAEPGTYAVEFWYEARLLDSIGLQILEQPRPPGAPTTPLA
ncbi:MAG: DUF6941 family protein [Candidatus Dormibacteria bacterium]